MMFKLYMTNFLLLSSYYIELCVPLKTVRIGRSDPEFIIPYIKSLLNKRSKLRKLGKCEEANNLATKSMVLLLTMYANS